MANLTKYQLGQMRRKNLRHKVRTSFMPPAAAPHDVHLDSYILSNTQAFTFPTSGPSQNLHFAT